MQLGDLVPIVTAYRRQSAKRVAAERGGTEGWRVGETNWSCHITQIRLCLPKCGRGKGYLIIVYTERYKAEHPQRTRCRERSTRFMIRKQEKLSMRQLKKVDFLFN